MITIRVGRRGRITIPRQIRRQIGIQEGGHVALMAEGDHVILRPIAQTLLDLRGSVAVSGPQDFSDIRQQVIVQRTRRTAKNES